MSVAVGGLDLCSQAHAFLHKVGQMVKVSGCVARRGLIGQLLLDRNVRLGGTARPRFSSFRDIFALQDCEVGLFFTGSCNGLACQDNVIARDETDLSIRISDFSFALPVLAEYYVWHPVIAMELYIVRIKVSS